METILRRPGWRVHMILCTDAETVGESEEYLHEQSGPSRECLGQSESVPSIDTDCVPPSVFRMLLYFEHFPSV